MTECESTFSNRRGTFSYIRILAVNIAATRSSKKTSDTAGAETEEKIDRSFVVVQFEEERQYGIVLVNWLVRVDGSWRKAK